MSVFALVHGAWHGGWSWERVAPELEVRGHRAVAPDLPCDVVEAGAQEYARVVVADALGDAEDVVLVGHSLAGLTVPFVAALRPVTRIVLIAALLPRPGATLIDQLKEERIVLAGNDGRRTDDDKRTKWTDAEAAARHLYTDVHPLLAAGAFARLRPQALKPHIERADGAWPDVPTEYVVCLQDRMISPGWQERASAPFTRRELGGGHSPMLSRAAELARLLCA